MGAGSGGVSLALVIASKATSYFKYPAHISSSLLIAVSGNDP